MVLTNKIIVVTGGGAGIGRAMCRRFAAERPARIVIADLDGEAARLVAAEISGDAFAVDVAREADIVRLVGETLARHGRIDLFCSNAGVAVHGGEETPDAQWERSWSVNVMAHVYAARAVLPSMLARGEGYLLQTISAAGLLSNPHSATYSATKHAALAFAEWLSIAYGDRGIHVSALCPMGVKTDMLKRAEAEMGRFLIDGALEPEQVADDVVAALADERFLVLPHPEVAEFSRRRAADRDRWLRGMRRSKN